MKKNRAKNTDFITISAKLSAFQYVNGKLAVYTSHIYRVHLTSIELSAVITHEKSTYKKMCFLILGINYKRKLGSLMCGP